MSQAGVDNEQVLYALDNSLNSFSPEPTTWLFGLSFQGLVCSLTHFSDAFSFTNKNTLSSFVLRSFAKASPYLYTS